MKKFFLVSVLCLLLISCDPGRPNKQIGPLFCIAVDIHANTEELKNTCELINKYAIGSVLIIGDQREVLPPDIDTRGSLAQWAHVINTINTQCSPRPLILADFERGPAMRLYDVPTLPKTLTCGAITDTRLIHEYGKEIGRQCKILGVDINLAPVLDVIGNPPNFIHTRSFGSDPARVARAGCAYIRGHSLSGVLTCAKHFPGHGNTTADSHETLPLLTKTLAELQKTELYPFIHAIKTGVPCVMPAHIRVPALDPNAQSATLSPKIIHDLLRTQLNFGGLVISDALRMRALTNTLTTQQIITQAFLAGNDILLFPADIETAINALQEACEKKIIDSHEVERRIQKINSLKKQLGTHNKKLLNEKQIRAELDQPRLKELKQKLYRAAMTLVHIPLVPSVRRSSPTLRYKFASQIHSGRAQTDVSREELPKAGTTTWAPVFGIKSHKPNYGISHQFITKLKKLCTRKKSVGVVLFGTPYSADLFDFVPTVFVAYEEDQYAQQAAAQVIAGKLKPTGKLPILRTPS